jgi:hypothetical protein
MLPSILRSRIFCSQFIFFKYSKNMKEYVIFYIVNKKSDKLENTFSSCLFLDINVKK